MATEDFKRKLTAILSADVVGYSRLMGDNEAETVKTLETYKSVMFSLIRQHRGRVVDSPGDNLLAEFGSVVDAVQCAVSIQKELQARNAGLSENRKMEFRIGINLGDVIEEQDRIYGDGVNIAARLEALADPGGICVSKTAFDHIENKLPLGYEFLGEQTVKNIAKPVGAYKILMETRVIEAKTKRESKATFFLRKKSVISIGIIMMLAVVAALYWHYYSRVLLIVPTPVEPEQTPFNSTAKESPKTIAVLPFDNLSSDPEQEYFSDGLSEELINKLSQVRGLQVTARTSSFYFKGKNEDIRTIAETLGVSYLLEGSVRRSGNQLRVTAQLIKAVDGYHLLSETYDRELKDIFTIQDDIAKAVTRALSITLGVGEFNRPGMTRDIEAYDEYLRSYDNALKFTPDTTLTAIEQCKRALEIDPDFGLGWMGLVDDYDLGITLLPPAQTTDFKQKIAEALNRARQVAPEMRELLLRTAADYGRKGNWLEADRTYRQMLGEHLHANPSANTYYGVMLLRAGRFGDAILYLQHAKRQNPLDPEIAYYLSIAMFNSKEMDDAFSEIKRVRTLLGADTLPSIVVEFVMAIEANDRRRVAGILTAYFDLGGAYPDAAMLRLSELLLMADKEAALSELSELSKGSYIYPLGRIFIAHVASELGDVELAFESFRESDSNDVLLAIWHPITKALRQLPAFKTYVRDIGLYDYWRTSGKWGDFCRPDGEDDFVCE